MVFTFHELSDLAYVGYPHNPSSEFMCCEPNQLVALLCLVLSLQRTRQQARVRPTSQAPLMAPLRAPASMATRQQPTLAVAARAVVTTQSLAARKVYFPRQQRQEEEKEEEQGWHRGPQGEVEALAMLTAMMRKQALLPLALARQRQRQQKQQQKQHEEQ